MIFVPIYHIYRFLKPSDDPKEEPGETFLAEMGIVEPTKKPDARAYYEPILRFLSGLGINSESARNAQGADEFAEMIVGALRRISGSEFVYAEVIQNRTNNNKYGLFFVTHHIRGAEKFLDARQRVKTQITSQSPQQGAFDFIEAKNISILRFIDQRRSYDNTELYELGIRSGIRPSELKSMLKDLENSSPPQITVSALPGKQRNHGGYYMNYDHYNRRDKIIKVTFAK